MTEWYNRIKKDDAALLLVDHQTGLVSGFVRDYPDDTFQQNIEALVDIGLFFNLPVVLTTSDEKGANGPLLPYIKEKFHNIPVIARPGEINAWDNEEFVAAVKKTGKNQLIIAGVVTDLCVAYVALSAINAGYEVFVVVDASGASSKQAADAALLRMSESGVQLMSWFSISGELQRDWRFDAEGFGTLLRKHFPAYNNVSESYKAAQNKK